MHILVLIFLICQVLQIDGYYNVILSRGVVSSLYLSDKYYDPLKEDPRLVEQVTNELNNIKTMTTFDIRDEIFQIKSMTKNEININRIKDRIELEFILARERVKLKLRDVEKKTDILKYRKKMTTLLKEESVIIDRDYTDFALAGELFQRCIEYDPYLKRKDLILLLALDNLKYLKPTYNDHTIEVEDDIEIRQVNHTTNIMTDIVDFADNVTVKIIDAASNISDRVNIPQILKKITTSKILNLTDKSSGQDFEAIQSEIERLSTFDEIILWSESQKNKNKLTQFLNFNGIEIPNNADHKLLAAILADFTLESRARKRISFTSNGYISESKSKTMKKQTRKSVHDINSYDKLQLENEIVNEIWNKYKIIVRNFSLGQFNQVIMTLLVKIQSLGATSLHSSFAAGFLASIQLFLALILRILLQVSKWSSGNLIQPLNTLVAVTLFTILTRGGIVKFVGTFIFIKLFRQLALLTFPMDIEHKEKDNFASL